MTAFSVRQAASRTFEGDQPGEQLSIILQVFAEKEISS